MGKSPISARAQVGKMSPDIYAHSIEVHTPSGQFSIGVDNNGRTYLSANALEVLTINPQSAGRVLIRSSKS